MQEGELFLSCQRVLQDLISYGCRFKVDFAATENKENKHPGDLSCQQRKFGTETPVPDFPIHQCTRFPSALRYQCHLDVSSPIPVFPIHPCTNARFPCTIKPNFLYQNNKSAGYLFMLCQSYFFCYKKQQKKSGVLSKTEHCRLKYVV